MATSPAGLALASTKEGPSVALGSAATPASRVALVSAVGLLTAGVLLQLLVAHPAHLFSRSLWFDEVVTHVLVADPDPVRAAVGLWNGVDNNVPGLFIGLRAFTALTGTASESVFRTFSLASVLLGLFGLYVSLSRCFAPAVTFAAVLAVWTHPLLLHHAFNARFYGPWFAAAVWFSYFISQAPVARRPVWNRLAVGTSALLLCMTHYFGVVTLLLVLAGEWLHRRDLTAARNAGFRAAGAGLLALAACAPLLASHVSKAGGATWVPPVSVSTVVRFGTELMLPAALAIIPMVVWMSHLTTGLRSHRQAPSTSEPSPRSLCGLSALALTPLFLVVFSYAAQPVLTTHYATAAVAGFTPGVALVLNRVSRAWLVALCGFFLLFGAQHLRDKAGDYALSDQRKVELIDVIRRNTHGEPVMFENLVVHEISHAAPDLARQLVLVDEDGLAVPPWASTGALSDQEWKTQRTWQVAWGRRFEGVYRFPMVMKVAELGSLPSAYIVLGDDPVNRPPRDIDSFYGFKLRHVERNLYAIVHERMR